jgi:hypothetical protein
MKKICGAVHVERWESDGKPREREVRCTMSPGHTGRHGWELDKGEPTTSGAAGHDWCAEALALRMLVRHFVSLGPRPNGPGREADIEAWAAWDAAWNALVERAKNLGVNP